MESTSSIDHQANRLIICPICSRPCQHYNELYDHSCSAVCCTDRPYSHCCPYKWCTRRFRNQTGLDGHMAAHLRHEFQIEVPRNGRMAIEYVLQNPSNQPIPTPIKTNDYPELLALDESEKPSNNMILDIPYTVDKFVNQTNGYQMFESIITLHDLEGYVSPNELLDLWTTFLSYDQRVLTLQQLAETNWHQDIEAIVQLLRHSGLGALTQAWVGFKCTVYAFPQDANDDLSAAQIIKKMLTLCMTLEHVRDKGYQMGVQACRNVPEILHLPSTSTDFQEDVPIVYLLSTLEDRVKCRTCQPEWLQLTKTMVLQEMSGYLVDLIITVKAMYPTQQDADDEDTELLISCFGTFW